MMTSSNGNIFRVTGPLCGEFTGPGEFPTQRPVTRSFDVYFDLRLNKRLSKQPWGWSFETLSWSLWRQCNAKGTPNGWIMGVVGYAWKFHYGVIKWKLFPRYWSLCGELPVTRSFDVFFELRLIKWLSKQWGRQLFETPSHSLWRHCNEIACWCCHLTSLRF